MERHEILEMMGEIKLSGMRAADLAPQDLLGTAYGWFNLTAGAMLLPASLIFGWLWQGMAAEAAFAFSAGCALAAAGLLKFWVLRSRPELSPPV